MEKRFSWNIGRHLIFSLGITCIAFISSIIVDFISVAVLGSDFSFRGNEAANIVIIGGSDGPTATFISGSMTLTLLNQHVLLFIFLLLLYVPIKLYVNKIIEKYDSRLFKM
ncbi:MAG: hypothetical protein CVV02_14550 [Firmicutes bacterium HGW-Firmicutes-7]|nr:MAG: hypothetical protein CVV02_14550 [Firmicutes bacterium HGW-Firmicutes-7]